MTQTKQDIDGFDTAVCTGAIDEYLSALDAVADEAKIEPHEGGFRTDATDPAHVALVRATLSADAFDTPEPTGDPFGVTVPRLRDLLTDTDTVGLEYDADTQKLDLVTGQFRYTHATLSADTVRNSNEPPEMDLPFEAKLCGDLFREAVEWFDKFTTHIRIGYDPSDATFWMAANERHGTSTGTDDGCLELARSELKYVRDAGHADSLFSADYTMDIVAAVPEGRTITVRVGEEYPMILSYPIHDADGEKVGRVKFMQAPRIQSE